MHMDFTYAPLGMGFAALMYLVGNGVWMNRLSRRRIWAGWLIWAATAAGVLLLGAAMENRLAGGEGVWATLTAADGEKHWIILTLYALMSVPAAACVMFRISCGWTRFATLFIAVLVFIPMGAQLQDPDSGHLLESLGITLATVGLIWGWSVLLDVEPEHRRRTVPVEEANR